ncbi:hypothetical protein Tco_0931280 [Tanacetum coccineum]
MHNYHWDRGAPRCAFKVDIQKAYDTVDCGFHKAALEGLGFHDKMIFGLIDMGNDYVILIMYLWFLLVPLKREEGGYFDKGSMRKGKAKVAWDVVCLPKDEGGLGIRQLDLFNKALMAVHVWKILTMKESLWVTWIHLHKIKDRNFWDLPCQGKMSWAWRKVLQLRPYIRKFVWHTIGDGARSLVCPGELEVKYPTSLSIPSPRLSLGTQDKLEWKSWAGSFKPFAVNTVWHSIRPRDVKVDWVDVVWFSNCIPRHAFNLWLAIKKKLKTQDRLSSLASYEGYGGLSHLPPSLEVILDFIVPMAKRRTSSSVISKLVLTASVYFIWLERNDRLFNNNKRTVVQVIECIISAIRLKLMSCRFKKSKVGLDS